MFAAQCLVLGRGRQIAENLAADAKQPERFFVRRQVAVQRGLRLLPCFLEGLRSALWPILNAGDESLGGQLVRVAFRRLAPKNIR